MSYDKVSLLLPMNGANNGTVFTDWSPVPKTVTRYGDAKTSTAQFKYYDSSGLFDGTGDILEAPFGAIGTKLRSQAFCFEMYVRPANVTGVKSLFNIINSTGRNNAGSHDLSPNDNSTQGNLFINDNVLAFYRATGATTGGSVVGAITITASAWTHVALTWDLTTLRLFVGGAADTSSTTWHDNAAPTLAQIYSICGWFNGTNRNNQNFNGHVQDLRVTIGDARYTAAFTPPARLLGTIDNSAVGASKILDINGDPAERTVFAVPRIAPTRVWSTVSDASGEFEIQAPAGVDHSVVALADETDLREDLVHRVIPV